MRAETHDVWEAMSTARTIRRFTDDPVVATAVNLDRWDAPATDLLAR